MMQTTNALVFLAILNLSFGAASGTVLNPVQQVSDLLDDLISKITKDGAAEDAAYAKYMIWCTEGKGDMEFEIKSCSSEIERLQAFISQSSAEITTSETRIFEVGSDISKNEADLTAITQIYEKEYAEFLEQEKELTEALDVIDRAINILERNMRGSALLQTKVLPSGASNLIHALDGILDGLAVSLPDRQRLTLLIQQHADDAADGESELNEDEDRSLAQLGSVGRNSRPSGVIMGEDDGVGAPAAAAYKHEASHSIIDILEDMRDKAQEELSELRKASLSSKHSFEMTVLSIKDEITAYKKEFTSIKTSSSASSETKSTAEGQLSVSKQTCAETKASLANLLQSCTVVAKEDHEASLGSRAEELRALAEARRIIAGSTGDAEKAVYGAASAAASFLQLRSGTMRLASGADLRNFEVVNLVRQLAKKTKSANLMQLAGKIAAALRLSSGSGEDPFVKVRGLISEMIDRLAAEARHEATHKDYCDQEMGKTKDRKDDLNTAIDKLTTKLDKAQSDITILKQEIAALQKALAELAKLQAEMDAIRAEEKAAFAQHKIDVTAGIEGVRRALDVLREHYNSAAAFLQIKQSSTGGPGEDWSDPTAGAVFTETSPIVQVETRPYPIVDPETRPYPIVDPEIQPQPIVDPETRPYPIVDPEIQPQPIVEPETRPYLIVDPVTGGGSSSSGAGGSIISLLEVIESDFGRSLAEAQNDEDAAQTEYEKTSMLNRLDKQQKEKDIEYKGQQVVKLERLVAELTSDLESTHTELNAVLEYWQTIQSACVVQPESFEERNRRRQAEIDGLKEALHILETEAAMVQVPSKGALRGARRHS